MDQPLSRLWYPKEETSSLASCTATSQKLSGLWELLCSTILATAYLQRSVQVDKWPQACASAVHQIPSHCLVVCSMGEFLTEAKKAEDGDTSGVNLYLAQHPLHEQDQLHQDLQTPACLEGIPPQSTNLWMCIQGSRTNIHFDPYQVCCDVIRQSTHGSACIQHSCGYLMPLGASGAATSSSRCMSASENITHHLQECTASQCTTHLQNLLTVIRGSKSVTLYPPHLTPYLYPAPLAGDSTNHSLVNFAAPDFDQHPLFR
jgi:hypothetical protein